ncbi:hypothetical protein ACTVKO_09590 [Serratia nevei]|uniref:hypothetical protein n=1 Tax=Serratia nevei TaxID=2703794 RepID=UPI003FA7A54B
MNAYEMEGFLRGKGLPGDLLVGESNVEYLVRKLNEAATLKTERDAQQKRADALAVENAALKSRSIKLFNLGYLRGHESTVEGYFVDVHWCDIDTYHDDVVAEIIEDEDETPATDVALAAIRSDYMAEGAEIVARKAQVIYQERHKSGDFESAGKYLTTIKFANNIAADIREAK